MDALSAELGALGLVQDALALLPEDLWLAVVLALPGRSAARLACAGRLFRRLFAEARVSGAWRARAAADGTLLPPPAFWDEVAAGADVQAAIDRAVPWGPVALRLLPGRHARPAWRILLNTASCTAGADLQALSKTFWS